MTILFPDVSQYTPDVTHTSRPGETSARCGADGPVVLWESVTDPDNPQPFTCGACWRDAAGGVEPMGGSLYLEAAHGAGVG